MEGDEPMSWATVAAPVEVKEAGRSKRALAERLLATPTRRTARLDSVAAVGYFVGYVQVVQVVQVVPVVAVPQTAFDVIEPEYSRRVTSSECLQIELELARGDSLVWLASKAQAPDKTDCFDIGVGLLG